VKSVSGKRLCKVLEEHGWELKRINGSHHVYAHPDRPEIVTVPVHGNRDLRVGTLHAILKEAGLTEADL
jgi:predicted RNA binding protein YcfA (HicA-like mRNA interferase family)